MKLMRSLIVSFLLSLSALGLTVSPASAAHVRYVYSIDTEWSDAGKRQSVVVETHWHLGNEATYSTGERFVPRSPLTTSSQPSGTQFGPFRLVSGDRAILSGTTDGNTPAQFAAMLRANPGLRMIEMRDCPGTSNDQANLKLGRMIRSAKLSTYVPAGGSVRSGAVELFLAGVTRRVDDGAEFAVHSWMDIYGRQAKDFALTAPQNRAYIDYYREMGMDEQTARNFYAMTNSVPFSKALWLKAEDMREWLGKQPRPFAYAPARSEPETALPSAPVAASMAVAENAQPRLAYLDFAAPTF